MGKTPHPQHVQGTATAAAGDKVGEAKDGSSAGISTSSTVAAPKHRHLKQKLKHHSSVFPTRKTNRIPHNEVERKYRNNLNIGIQRLRNHIPTFPRHNYQSSTGSPKPSKVLILAAAVDYIKHLEAEAAKLTGREMRPEDKESNGDH